ncbi:hypothetical protein EDC01DRAFT_640035 [Geopyxis carbonaria]|nr:hypothetical protein EDC01DRAFT_640035 [Geopyxis carbonaria]
MSTHCLKSSSLSNFFIMKIATFLLVLCAGVALAGVANPEPPTEHAAGLSAVSDDDQQGDNNSGLKKRRGCTGHRLTTDVCQGKVLNRRNSHHNCLKTDGGHCCAESRTGDKGIDVKNKAHDREDCGYCFSGYCRGGK